MNYIGSKLGLIDFLKESIFSFIYRFDSKFKTNEVTFGDLFAGTGAVGVAFKELGCSIIANDIQYYSYVLNRHLIGNTQTLDTEKCSKLFEEINSLEGIEGFIYNNFAEGGTKDKEYTRLYYTDYNAKKCDAIRQFIETKHLNGEINDDEYFFLLASLINSIDKYANTASVYGAFLKEIKKSAQKELVVTPLPIISGDKTYNVYNEDISELVKKISGDILYLDPPYNTRQYCSNYHLLETIAKYDNPELKGKTGLRVDEVKSDFSSKNGVHKAFEDVIKNANFKYIFLSYNNEGIMTIDEIRVIMEKYGTFGMYTKDYHRFKADSNRYNKANSTIEYLFCLRKER